MNNNINILLEKYWKAETTTEEDTQLKTYFLSSNVAQEHLQYISLFDYFNQKKEQELNNNVLENVKYLQNIDLLIDKYFATECTIEEERFLKSYLTSESVDDKHVGYADMFHYFEVRKSLTLGKELGEIKSDKDIDFLIEKYFSAESTLEEEEHLMEYLASGNVKENHSHLTALSTYVSHSRNEKSGLDIRELISEENLDHSNTNSKIVSLKKWIPAVAAVFVLGLAAVSLLDISDIDSGKNYKGKYVKLDEASEAQEAYEITKQALALLSSKVNKGTSTVQKSIGKVEKAKIFK